MALVTHYWRWITKLRQERVFCQYIKENSSPPKIGILDWLRKQKPVSFDPSDKSEIRIQASFFKFPDHILPHSDSILKADELEILRLNKVPTYQ